MLGSWSEYPSIEGKTGCTLVLSPKDGAWLLGRAPAADGEMLFAMNTVLDLFAYADLSGDETSTGR